MFPLNFSDFGPGMIANCNKYLDHDGCKNHVE